MSPDFGWDYPPGVTGREPEIAGRDPEDPPGFEFVENPQGYCDDCGEDIVPAHEGSDPLAWTDGGDTVCDDCAWARVESRMDAMLDAEEERKLDGR